MEKLNSGVYKFCKIVAYLGAISIIIMMLATVVDVFCRKVIGQTYPGATEIVSYLLTAVVYFGVGYCAMERGMITIDLFKQSKIMMVINNLLSVIVSFIIVYATAIRAVQSYGMGGSSLRLQIPKWPFMIITAFGFLVMAIIIIMQTIEDIKAKPAAISGDGASQIDSEIKGGDIE